MVPHGPSEFDEMKLLLDTCAFIWFLGDAPQLSSAAKEAILDPQNDVFLSSVSVWEIARKHAAGSLALDARPEILIPAVREASGIKSLPLTESDALSAEKLPPHHTDPIDRMLMAQALMNGLMIVTSDRAFEKYPVRLLW